MTRVARRPELTLEEEQRLIGMAQKGCARSAAAVMSHADGFVVGEAAKVIRETGARTWRDDIEQEGRLALLRQLHKYDLNSKARLTSYAYRWVRAAMVEKACDCLEVVRLAHDTDAQAAHRDLERGDEPSVVAERHGLSEDRVRSLPRHTVSLRALDREEIDPNTLRPTSETVERAEAFSRAFKSLPWRKRQLVAMRLDGMDDTQCAALLGLNRYDFNLYAAGLEEEVAAAVDLEME